MQRIVLLIVLCTFSLFALQSCIIYGYQPNAMRVTQATAKGKVEAGANIGLGFPVIPVGGVYATYSPANHFLIGVTGDRYSANVDSISTSTGFILSFGRNSDEWKNFKRSGYSVGGYVGTYYELDKGLTFLAQGGVNSENIQQQFDRYSYQENPVHYSTNALYLKPWIQASLRCKIEISDQNLVDVFCAFRLSQFNKIRSTQSIPTFETENKYPVPTDSHFMDDYMAGIELHATKNLSFSMQSQLAGNNQSYANIHYWNTPLLSLHVGGTYVFSK